MTSDRVALRKVSGRLQRYSGISLAKGAMSGGRYWQRMWGGDELESAYDVVVVGAGGHGLATAYHLARDHGLKNVAVLDRKLVGYGNVGRNTTIVRSNYLLPENHHFYEDSLKRWETLSSDLNFNVMYSPRGVLAIANSDAVMMAFARQGNAMRVSGIDAELLDRDQLRRFAPELDFDGHGRYPVVGGLLQPRGGTVRHDAVAWGYARAAAALGVSIIEGCEVTGLTTEAGIATGVETSLGEVRANRVVFAVAGHTGAIGALLGIPLPIETHLLQAMVTEPTKPLLNTVVILQYDHGEVYVSQSDRGGLVMGGHLDGFPSCTQNGQWSRLQDVVEGAIEVLPQAAGLRLLRQWAGINDMTMDGSPIIDRFGWHNVFLNGGWCYGGFKAIPASGAACAEFVATGNVPELIRHFSMQRFADGAVLDEPGSGPFPVRQ